MRLSSLALPVAFFATAGLGLAQNAISLWKSDNGQAGLLALGVGGATGQAGNKMFHTLPGDVLTYFKPNLGARALDFVGFETLWQSGSGTVSHNLPGLDLQTAEENPAAPARLLPSEAVSAIPAWFSLPSGTVNLGIIPAGQRVHVQVTGAPVAVPAGNTAGQGLSAVCQNYQQQAGAASLLGLFTLNGALVGQETYTDQTDCLSGIKFATNPVYFYLTQLFVGASTITRAEWAITYLFKQSMISPVKNSQVLTVGSPIPGGVVPAGTFAFKQDNGAGALRPNAGDVLSYSGNSDMVAQGSANQPWFLPFVMFDGNTVGTDPAPENWNNPGKSNDTYVHAMSTQKFIDDVIAAFGGTNFVGAALAPNNPTQAIWFGIDSPAFATNFTIMLDAFTFADTSNGIQWAGPSLPARDSVLQPTGVLLRNGIVDGGKTAEHATFVTPQNGFSPIVAVGPFVGFGANPGGVVAGRAFYIQCWMLDVASTTTVTNYNLVDMTNAIKITLGN